MEIGGMPGGFLCPSDMTSVEEASECTISST